MVDTYTQALKARKIEPGGYDPDWSTRFNGDVVDIFDAGISGQIEIDIGSATTHALEAMQNGTLSDSHYFRLNFVGTPASAVTVTVPASVTPSKHYLVDNQTGQTLTVKYAATSGVTIQDGDAVHVYCDGTTVIADTRRPRYDITDAEIAALVTPTDYAHRPGYLQRTGGDSTGTASSATALANAAAQNAQTGGVAVKISGGTYRIDANTTIAAGVTLDFTEGGALTIDAGDTLTINGKILAQPNRQIFFGSGTVVIGKDVNPDVWANWFVGSDIGAKINAAIDAVSNVGPLTIRVAPGSYSYSTKIDLLDSESIRLTGCDTYVPTPNNRNPNLIWTGAAGTGNAIDASGAFGFELDHLSITYSSAAYDGNLISLGIGTTLEARLCEIHHCSIQGTSTALLAARLIELEGTLATSIYKNYFRYAVRGIGATAQSCNGIAIRDNWLEKDFTAAQIQVRGGAWDISCNIFEGKDPGGPVPALELTGETNALSFRANMCVDGAVGTGTLIDLSGAVCTSATIENNTLSGGATGVLLRATAGESRGISIRNNYLVNTTGVNMAAGKNIEVTGNRFQCTTPWTGTNPQRYFVNNNDMNGTSTSGIPVANTDSIQLAVSSLEGSGLIFVYSVEDNAQAIFALNGTANTTTEISDPGGIFSNTVSTATSINIYSSGGNSYRLENLRGAARTVIVNSFLGR